MATSGSRKLRDGPALLDDRAVDELVNRRLSTSKRTTRSMAARVSTDPTEGLAHGGAAGVSSMVNSASCMGGRTTISERMFS